MKNTKVLEMINQGKLEDLKIALQDEIYQESLKGKTDAKKRYAAMKKYFTYVSIGREILQRPCEIVFEGERYFAFTNSYSLALTKETCGEIKLCEEPERYPDVTRLISYQGDRGIIDFNEVLAKAKSLGYKLKKSEVGFDYKYLMHYNGSYFKIGLIDSTFSIINDGRESVVYHVSGNGRPITIQTKIGVCMVMPIRYEGDPRKEGYYVIEAKN